MTDQIEAVVKDPLASLEVTKQFSQQGSARGYDVEVLKSLTPDMRRKVVADNIRELISASGFDNETILILLDGIRQEVLDQATKSMNATSAPRGDSSISAPESSSGVSSSTAASPHEIGNAPGELHTVQLYLRLTTYLTCVCISLPLYFSFNICVVLLDLIS
jgi:hypothetical protein